MKFSPKNPAFAEQINESFKKQAVMQMLGAKLSRLKAGRVTIKLPFRQDLTQQNGFLHAGISAAIADSACGYAALSLMPENSDVVSVEFKINLLEPAVGEYFLATGKVERAGKTLTVVGGKVFAVISSEKHLVATILGTMMRLEL